MAEQLAVDGGRPIWSNAWPEWPVRDEREVEAVTRIVRSGNWWRFSYGRGVELAEDEDAPQRSEVAAFQQAFALAHGCRRGIAAANGTVTLEIALRALGVRPGDEVIVPAYSFIATASAVLSVNAVPIFADIDPETYNLAPACVEQAITDKTRAIIPVHFGGQPADMDALNAMAATHSLAVLEDAAHAHGSEYNGRRCGSLGDAASFSFQSSKPMTAGEGGIITTNSDDLADACESLVWAGRRKGEPWYRHYVLAGNARLTEFQGAILLIQLSRLERQVERRMTNAALLDQLLADIEGIEPCPRLPATTRHSYHIYMFRYHPEAFGGLSKGDFVAALQAEGITPAFAGYPVPLYQNPMFLERSFWGGDCPVNCPRYGREINYAAAAARCPVSERACSTEAVWLTQTALMGGADEVTAIAQAIHKIQRARTG